MLTPILPRKSLSSYVKVASSLVMAACFTSPAQASTAQVCDAVEKLARSVAFNRQAGTPMMRMVQIADEAKKDAVIRDLAIDMVTSAYSSPVYQTPDSKINFVVSFGERWAMICVQALR